MPVEFYERLQYGYADGSIRVMVALAHRSAAIERDMEAGTSALAWYGDGARFFGVTPRSQQARFTCSFQTSLRLPRPHRYRIG